MDRLVVDGYNVIHAWVPLKRLLDVSLEAARDKLIERLAVYAMVTGSDVTVVFDAHHSAARTNSEGHSADHVIERIAYAATGTGDAITVATSDRTQRDLVRGMGGAVIDARELERRVVDAEQEMGRRVDRYAR